MGLDFSYEVEGLVVSLTAITEIPSSREPEWDFGDFTGTVSGTNVTHRYNKPGPFKVTLTVYKDDPGEITSTCKTVEVTGVITHLPKSIYDLIDLYIPSETGVEISDDEKEMYITKWQLYIQPLVNHEIPISRYSNEDYYEALENQLITELAVYDIISTHLTDLILTAGNSLQGYMSKVSGPDSDEEGNGNIKAITTGPTEVQFYQDLTDSLSTMYKAYSSSVGPGGILDILKQNLCTLASRLVIFLPFCEVNNTVITPRVVNRRPPSNIIGPNPYKSVLK